MTDLQRLTTDYVEHEDRVRLSGVGADAHTVVLWLTQRLLNRLVPPLCQWLERSEPKLSATHTGRVMCPSEPAQQAVQGFAQAHAQAQLKPQAPVQAAAAAPHWVVVSVQLVSSADTVRLIFKGSEGEEATLTLSAQPLRQWLGIVRQRYIHGEWPTTVWPAWMVTPAPTQAPGHRAAMLH